MHMQHRMHMQSQSDACIQISRHGDLHIDKAICKRQHKVYIYNKTVVYIQIPCNPSRICGTPFVYIQHKNVYIQQNGCIYTTQNVYIQHNIVYTQQNCCICATRIVYIQPHVSGAQRGAASAPRSRTPAQRFADALSTQSLVATW